MSSDQFGSGWGKRWIDSLERLATAWQSRLPRGKDYADKGHVISLSVTAGRIAAKVQGSRSKPYSTTIDVNAFRDGDWERVSRRLTSQAHWAAELLCGHMPRDIEQIFGFENMHLFPVRNSEMIGNCTCPDKSKPCKHIAAVHYAFANALDRDPFLLFQLRGVDRSTLLRYFRRSWFGADAVGQTIEGLDNDNEKGMPVMPLSADRFNRSPAPVEHMSFTMQNTGQPLLILQRLGAPSSWQLPLSIQILLGPVYEESAKMALSIALAEINRDELVSEGDTSEFDSIDDFDDEGFDEDDDEDDDGDDDDFEDDEDDGADDDDQPTPAPKPAELSAYKALSVRDDVIDGRSYSYSPPAGAQLPPSPSPAADFFLPKSLGAVTSVAGYKPPEPVEQDERSSVLIRKGVAALNRRRNRNRTTGSLRTSTEGQPVISPSAVFAEAMLQAPPLPTARLVVNPPTTPLPGLPGSVVAITPKSRDEAPPTPIRRRKAEAAEPIPAPAEVTPTPKPTPPPAAAVAPEPEAGTPVMRRRIVEPAAITNTRTGKGRHGTGPAPIGAITDIGARPIASPPPAFMVPPGSLPATVPSPAAPSRTASAVPIQSTIGRPAAVAEPAPDTTSDAAIAARRRGRSASTLITIAGDVPALKPLTAPEAETQCKHSLESGDADVALETARRAWHLEPNLGRYLLLMASTDLSEKQRDLINVEADRTHSIMLRSGRVCAAELLLLMSARRVDSVVDFFDRFGDEAWTGEEELASIFIPWALMSAVEQEESLSPDSSIMQLWDELFSRGEDAFPTMDNQPAPVGVWLQWAMQEFPLSEPGRRRLLQMTRTLIERMLAIKGTAANDQKSMQAAHAIVGLYEALALVRRREEGRSLLAAVRPHVASRRRLARALEEALEASPILND
jgi:uncharacterized Zn finger protein